MRSTPVILLFLGTLLAGCTGGAEPAAPDQSDFDDLPVAVTATTGAIRGVVVDERITPIEGATIGLTGAAAAQSKVSDAQGRFAFGGLEPGTYFLAASSPLHTQAQTSVEVVAGIAEPPVTRVLLERLFDQEPFVTQQKFDGFIQCNQAGVVYASAPCITDFTGLQGIGATLNGTVPGCTPAGCASQLRRIQDEYRGFRTSVDNGWQSIILEMVWQESSETFEQMGITFSYNETQRPGTHWYARSASVSPLWMEIRAGEVHAQQQDEPEMIPLEGHQDLYYFVGVRTSSAHPVALAVNQKFVVFQTNFYFAIPPEGWSFVNDDPMPF
jgi:hypothetical protein